MKLLRWGSSSEATSSGHAHARSKTALDLAMLYVSKAGAVLVGILILPQFSRLLGADQFGIVAVIFSLQALLLTLDLGMSTLLSRDLAAERDGTSSWLAWRTSEMVVSALYVALIPLALILAGNLATGLSIPQLLMAMLLFWILTIQNIGQTALLATRQFMIAGSAQFVGVLTRGIATLATLQFIEASLTAFLLAQVAVAFGQVVVTRAQCAQKLRVVGTGREHRPNVEQCVRMASRARSLILFGLSGAAVMQLDKPIISAFTSAAQVAPYYLATALCLTPLSLLASPVAQFFQPRLVSAIAASDDARATRVLRFFTTSIVTVVVFPSALLWALRRPIVATWLGSDPLVEDVAVYTGILLPGVAAGALGFVPYGILVARQDYRFQAFASSGLTLITLCAAVACARLGSIEGVCWVYSCYHATSTVVSWMRCCTHMPQGGSAYARASALETLWIAGAATLMVTATIAMTKHFL